MTDQERIIVSIADMIEGEINRMCVTKEVKELEAMMNYAWKNMVKIYTLRLVELKGVDHER